MMFVVAALIKTTLINSVTHAMLTLINDNEISKCRQYIADNALDSGSNCCFFRRM